MLDGGEHEEDGGELQDEQQARGALALPGEFEGVLQHGDGRRLKCDVKDARRKGQGRRRWDHGRTSSGARWRLPAPQRLDGVEAGHAPCRVDAREQAQHERRRRGRRRRSSGWAMKCDVGHHARPSRAARAAHTPPRSPSHAADEAQQRVLDEEEARERPRRGAEGLPHADLGGPLHRPAQVQVDEVERGDREEQHGHERPSAGASGPHPSPRRSKRPADRRVSKKRAQPASTRVRG